MKIINVEMVSDGKQIKIEPGDIVLRKIPSPYSDTLIESPYKIVGGVTIQHPGIELTIGQAETFLKHNQITAIYKLFWDHVDIEEENKIFNKKENENA